MLEILIYHVDKIFLSISFKYFLKINYPVVYRFLFFFARTRVYNQLERDLSDRYSGLIGTLVYSSISNGMPRSKAGKPGLVLRILRQLRLPRSFHCLWTVLRWGRGIYFPRIFDNYKRPFIFHEIISRIACCTTPIKTLSRFLFQINWNRKGELRQVY